MTHWQAALLGAGFGIVAAFLFENRASSVRDIAETVGIFGIAGAAGGWTAATRSIGVQQKALRVVAASAFGGLSAGIAALIVGSVYYVLAYPYDGQSLISGIMAGIDAFVAGLVTGGIIGAQRRIER